jgi:hypothetical protein
VERLFIEAAIHRNGYSSKRLFTEPTQKCTIHQMSQYGGSGNCQWLFTFWHIHQMHKNGTSKNCPSMPFFTGIPNLQSELLNLLLKKVKGIQSEINDLSNSWLNSRHNDAVNTHKNALTHSVNEPLLCRFSEFPMEI